MYPRVTRCKLFGLDVARRRQVGSSTDPQEPTVLVIRTRIGLDGSALGADVIERWCADVNAASVEVTVTPSAFWPQDLPLPRIGWTMALPQGPDQLEYEGYGPHECYPDTGGGVTFGTWTSSVADFQVPYVFPQENGSRAGVVRAALTGPDAGSSTATSTGAGASTGARASTGAGASTGARASTGAGASTGLELRAERGLGLAVRPWSTAELDG